ncbi:alpha-D-xyloside xylohydrolase [Granulicella pectinivorans]|uniref:Alpha-D-xyloside xylohydrolase n=1 Tax=Granulicella pectinivorans TaxID=474950 RepID=A0A1I6MXF4_9BACT|nr:TIM-barrel domain-containing protein [Granulicella pectinivorans]SFS20396.1 alpha-D-xyloside xylohydrolase [Granulicella pectinivorans]
MLRSYFPVHVERLFPRLIAIQFVLAIQLSSFARIDAQQSAYSKTATMVTVSVNGDTIEISPLEEGVIRVRISKVGAPPEPGGPGEMLLLQNLPAPRFEVKQTPEAIVVTAGNLAARVNRHSGKLSFTDSHGKLLLTEEDNGRKLPDSHPGEELPTLQESFVSAKDESLFGGGQFQDGFLDVRDLPRRLTQVNTQISIPFLLSNKGYGLLWHNYGRTDLNPADTAIHLMPAGTSSYTINQSLAGNSTGPDVRKSASFRGDFEIPVAGAQAMMLDSGWKMERRYKVEIDGKPVMDFANFWLPPTTSWFSTLAAGKHSIRLEGDIDDQPTVFFRPAADRTTWRSFSGHTIDYVVFAGPSADDVIRRYRDVTGSAPLMPKWAYGFIQSRARYSSQKELQQNLETFREKQLPLDLIVQDWMYWGKYGWNAMKFDENDYPDPAGMVNSVHDLHAHIMISVWSRIAAETEIGKEFQSRGFYVPGTDWVDFFNPEARALYWKDFSTHMVPFGFDAWWLDATEPENDDIHGRKVFTGAGDDVRLLYPLLVNRTVYEGLRKDVPGKRVMLLTRNAFLGQQRYASAVWSGDVGNDWETLRREIVAGLGYSASGLPYWTSDTGGFFRSGTTQFSDPAYQERLMRWLEFSAFTPLMRVHGWLTPTELWLYGSKVETVGRKYLELRSRMIPYIYSEAAQVTSHGSTLLRPLVMDFPSDPKALQQKYEFMFGKDLLVAPVTDASVTSARVYLPSAVGGWYNFWTEKHLPGAQVIASSAPVDIIPLFVRAGSILPLGPVSQYSEQHSDGPIELVVYPGQDGSFTLYDDEGSNYDYETGQSSKIVVRWDDKARELHIGARLGSFRGMLRERSFVVRMVGGNHASHEVRYGGDAIRIPLD